MNAYQYGTKKSGFTLIEMLLAIAILVASSVYFINLFSDRFEAKQGRQLASELLSVSRVVSTYFSINNKWPIKSLSNCDTKDVFTLLGDYAKGFSKEKFSFECSKPDYIVIKITADNEDAAIILSQLLPLASANGKKVDLVVLKPRMPITYKFVNSEVDNNGYAFVNYPDCNRPQISVAPTTVCVASGGSLGGYRLVVENIDNKNQWRLSLQSRNDTVNALFSKISTCDSEKIKFRAFVFCDATSS